MIPEAGFPYYVWLVAGLALCALETVVPGAFLIWIGLAGLFVGVIEFLLPAGFGAQALEFAALTLGLVLIGRKVYGSLAAGGDQLPLSRAHALIGRAFPLETAIVNGFGSIRVGDSVWRVAGDDMPAGAQVRVAGLGEGAAIRVERVQEGQ